MSGLAFLVIAQHTPDPETVRKRAGTLRAQALIERSRGNVQAAREMEQLADTHIRAAAFIEQQTHAKWN